jgi:sister chromatid cohesion protein DCC1
VRAIQDELYDIQEIRREVTRQVLAWFGTLSGSDDKEIWSINHASIVREIGLGLLRPHTLTSSQTSPLRKTTFLSSWSEAVGDTFVSYISLSLLSGFYLLHPSPTFPDDSSQETISYYPATALPTAPTARFADLFLTRPKWRYEDLVPFLEGVAVDSKERDKLLIKYGRASTDKDGKIWYTAKTAMF